MAKFLIIGGGLAGLSSAVYLFKDNHQVELIEASPKLGGRAYSFFDKETRTEIDNGQHILLGAYKNTLRFLKIIGAEKLPEYQKSLKVVFVSQGGELSELNADNFIYPFNLLMAILKLNTLNLSEKLHVIKFVSTLQLITDSSLNNKTALTWLKDSNQSENIIKSLWEIIAVGALNTSLSEGSAVLLKNTLKKMFLQGSSNPNIILPKVGLSKLFVEPALTFLQNYNCSVNLSERVNSFIFTGKKISGVVTNNRVIKDYDFIISSVPPYSFFNIEGSDKFLSKEYIQSETSSITSVYIWLENNFLTERFYALIDSKIHWVFNHGRYISIVISASDELIEMNPSDIYKVCFSELQKYFPKFDENNVLNCKIIKEKRATIKTTPQFEELRSKLETQISNLIFTGDWTNTKLPCTIESAILSGKKVSDYFKKVNSI